MRKHTTIAAALLALLALSVAGVAGTIIQEFSARAEGADVVLEWAPIPDEGEVEAYVAERRTDAGEFVQVGSRVNPRAGVQHYTLRLSVFEKGGTQTLVYRVRALSPQQSELACSPTLQVDATLSLGEQTWGGLKAMFR